MSFILTEYKVLQDKIFMMDRGSGDYPFIDDRLDILWIQLSIDEMELARLHWRELWIEKIL